MSRELAFNCKPHGSGLSEGVYKNKFKARQRSTSHFHMKMYQFSLISVLLISLHNEHTQTHTPRIIHIERVEDKPIRMCLSGLSSYLLDSFQNSAWSTSTGPQSKSDPQQNVKWPCLSWTAGLFFSNQSYRIWMLGIIASGRVRDTEKLWFLTSGNLSAPSCWDQMCKQNISDTWNNVKLISIISENRKTRARGIETWKDSPEEAI